MPKALEKPRVSAGDDRLRVPTKSEILEALQQDSNRGGLQLEWMLDRCEMHEGPA